MKMLLLAALLLSFRAAAGPAPGEGVRVIDFSEGKWDRAAWTPLLMINQDEPRLFTQHADSIGVTLETFHPDDYRNESDNAILVTDTGTTEGQIEVTFTMGKGFNGFSSPGILIAPEIVDGRLERCVAVFAARYGVVAWFEEADHERKRMRVCHMGQIARWSDPDAKHVLRCRWSKRQKAVAVQIDDSDILVFRFLGHKTLSRFPAAINSTVGIWACHGVCAFYEAKILNEGTLPFEVRNEPVKP